MSGLKRQFEEQALNISRRRCFVCVADLRAKRGEVPNGAEGLKHVCLQGSECRLWWTLSSSAAALGGFPGASAVPVHFCVLSARYQDDRRS